MKNNIKSILGLACLAIFAIGCEDDFLDEQPTGGVINSDQLSDGILLNPSLGEATVTGIYATMFTTGTGGTTSQQDFGQKGYDIYGDMLSSDMALSVSTYGWYRSRITEMQAGTDFTQQENYQVWRYYYRIVNLSNLVIESLGGNDAIPETDDNKFTLGQAFAMRAHAYFYLTQYMINDVEASWNSETLPIYIEPGFIGNPKSTTQEVYALMEDDLTKAISLLDGYARPSKTQVDKSVAQTILAYVLASRRDRWDDVVTLTNNALANTTASAMEADDSVNGILGGFNDVASQGWMWGVDLNEDIALGLVSWWGQMDAFSYSYAAFGDNKSIDVDLYESMPADDIRRGQFENDSESDFLLQPLNKFYDSDRTLFGASQIVKADYIYMRYEEPLLLNIEALANSGQEGLARTALFNFVSTRVGDATYINALSGQALLDEIYLQTRLELWGEGKSYLAMKRNKATIVRGANHLSFTGTPIPFDDERLTFEIPQQELQDNNNITTQN
ncbi:RagB/SusD family nutrient uptake outer membrane protein [Cellulophaga baltica]|uniref:Glycan metabolism protein RagB n=1 Tax=Cellulophaga baltica 18 TaxID=1348584 RepID=A0AAU8R7Z0_9FLAO|nr:RagB/SusD family nutrient uptake outer membrane protein [Cellulophaga baltica]AIZ40422.1 glycan metabolism protein RagB [Cellulophaga baltica 18]WFO15572.1 RagB/SusD family nutrient uptake outer membrane protein [Cellulophaga baltica 4]